MNLPSRKTLARVFDDPKAARALLEATRATLEATDAGDAMIRRCWHPPKRYELRMECLNALDSGLCGVEGVEVTPGEWLTYLNAGDCYNDTLFYWRGRYSVGAISSILERFAKSE